MVIKRRMEERKSERYMGSRSEMAGKQATKLVSKQTSERAKKYVIDHF